MRQPKEIAEDYVGIGLGKVNQKMTMTFLLAIMAGMFVALAGAGSIAASCAIENTSVVRLISACVFPSGLAMVILAGSELFTGSCMLTIPILERKCSPIAVIRTLVIVFIGNFVGSIIISWLFAYSQTPSLCNGAMLKAVMSTAEAKCEIPFTVALLKGILCNILVCIAVWMSFAAKSASGKIIMIYFPIMAFVLCGYEHSVANMFYMPAALFSMSAYHIESSVTWSGFLLNNLIPVTIGNIIGGCFVGFMYWLIYLKKKVK